MTTKALPSDRAYAGEVREMLVQMRVDLRQGEELIKGHEKEIVFHRAHIALLKKQLRHRHTRALCLRREHNEWRQEVGLPLLKGRRK